MKILVNFQDSIAYYTILNKDRYRKIIDSFKSGLIEYDDLSVSDLSLYGLQGNDSVIDFLIKQKYTGWINISEENQFLVIFTKRVKSAFYVKTDVYEPAEPRKYLRKKEI